MFQSINTRETVNTRQPPACVLRRGTAGPHGSRGVAARGGRATGRRSRPPGARADSGTGRGPAGLGSAWAGHRGNQGIPGGAEVRSANRRGGDTGGSRGQVRPGQRAVRRLPEGKVCACVCVRVRPAEGEEEDANRTPRRCHGDRRRRGGPATSRCPQPWAGLPRRVLEQCPARIRLAGRGSRSASGDCPRGAATVPSRGRPHARLGPRLFPPRGHRPGRVGAHSESLVSP